MGTDNIFHKKKAGQLKRERKSLKEYKNSILIVCEGEQTEPNYFKKFPVANIRVVTIGIGTSNITLIENAIDIWKTKADEGKYFESLWCVFDRDDFPQANYNQAFKNISTEGNRLNRRYHKKTGRKIKVNIAYSNEAFELWYLLHFNYIDSALSRSQYQSMLSKRMKRKYIKNNPDMYRLLNEYQQTAIENAKKLEINIEGASKHNHNPSTTVYKLVEELNSYLRQ